MRIIKAISVLLVSLILTLAARQYLFCPQYVFEKGQHFSGEKWCNPYVGMDSSQWIKCNFHAHTKAWLGITNGKGNAGDVWEAYERLGYGIHCVSDYEKINTAFQDRPNYISAYEHGYNILKTHQLVLGDVDVVGLDYFFPQTLSNKQDLLRRLSANRENLVIVNHPSVRNGYRKSDFSYLTNYHCMEIASPYQTSVAYWDEALSAGKPIFAVANDDIHNIFNSRGIGRFFTCVNSAEASQTQVLNGFKQGRHYTMIAADIEGEGDEARTDRLKRQMPALSSFIFQNDSLCVRFSVQPLSVKFIGQDGVLLKSVQQDRTAHYKVRKEDTYVRTEVEFADGTLMYLNPVFRFGDEQPLERNFTAHFVIETWITLLLNGIGCVLILSWVLLVYRIWKSDNKAKG